jgi:hypothetical protein
MGLKLAHCETVIICFPYWGERPSLPRNSVFVTVIAVVHHVET